MPKSKRNMKKLIFLSALCFSASLFSQTLYVPKGTNGIGTSSNGNVGIGTSTPTQNLSIKAARPRLVLTDEAGDAGVIEFHESANQIRLQKWDKSGSDFNKTMMVLDGDNGFVGIGTANPAQILSIQAERPRLVLTDKAGDAGVMEFHESTNQIRLQKWDKSGSDFNKTMMVLDGDNGFVGIGTASPKSKLAVNGKIRATEIVVLSDINVPDYVFEPDYELRSLKETKAYISENKHLPEIPSASEIGENGISLGEMNMKLLKKIEELTLYQIELLERLESVEAVNEQMKKQLQELNNKK